MGLLSAPFPEVALLPGGPDAGLGPDAGSGLWTPVLEDAAAAEAVPPPVAADAPRGAPMDRPFSFPITEAGTGAVAPWVGLGTAACGWEDSGRRGGGGGGG